MEADPGMLQADTQPPRMWRSIDLQVEILEIMLNDVLNVTVLEGKFGEDGVDLGAV